MNPFLTGWFEHNWDLCCQGRHSADGRSSRRDSPCRCYAGRQQQQRRQVRQQRRQGCTRCQCGYTGWATGSCVYACLCAGSLGICPIMALRCQGEGFWDVGVGTAGSLLNLQLFLLSIRCCPPYLPCRACRAVWYCGTACSHADRWEGGHRRICKALGAARAAEKAARRQQPEGSQVQPAAG